MKKLICTVILLFNFFGSAPAHAMAVIDVGSIAQEILILAETAATAIETAATAVATEATAITTELMAAYDKLAHSEVIAKWVEAYQHATEISDKATSLITGARGMGGALADGSYKYKKEELPDSFTPQIYCTDGSNCRAVGNGYFGSAAAVSSKSLRDNSKVDPLTVNVANTIQQISAAAAEKNAQELAVIQAMAQEAYVVTNNRIALIEELKGKIDKPDDATKDDAKYIANLQAQLQSQQALLGNEQNKLTALAILQQSQRDAYEQRKKEIAAYVVKGNTDSHIAGRAMISTAQKTAYDQVAAAYR